MKKLLIFITTVVSMFALLLYLQGVLKAEKDISDDPRVKDCVGKVYELTRIAYIRQKESQNPPRLIGEGSLSTLPESYEDYISRPEFWREEEGVQEALLEGDRIRVTRVTTFHSDFLGPLIVPRGEIMEGQHAGEEIDFFFLFYTSCTQADHIFPDDDFLKHCASD